jgi:hypothetical protein
MRWLFCLCAAAALQPPPTPPVVGPAGSGLLFLNSSRLKVAVDTRRGGAISHLSSPLLPGPWTNTNMINTWDSGRLVQQSYYGCPDGSCWSERPWRFNPVQVRPKLWPAKCSDCAIVCCCMHGGQVHCSSVAIPCWDRHVTCLFYQGCASPSAGACQHLCHTGELMGGGVTESCQPCRVRIA